MYFFEDFSIKYLAMFCTEHILKLFKMFYFKNLICLVKHQLQIKAEEMLNTVVTKLSGILNL